jgi:glycosyltransferase involved in cell wall biosynthesis
LHLIYLSDALIPSRSSNSMQVMRMCAGFASRGVDVTLVHPKMRAAAPEGFTGDITGFYGVGNGFKRRPLPVGDWAVKRSPNLSRVCRLGAMSGYLLRRGGPGQAPFACYARSPLAAWAAVRIRRRWGRRGACKAVLLELHDEPPQPTAWKVLSDVDGVVAISQALRARLLERPECAEETTWVEHDGVDLDGMELRRLDRARSRARLGMPEPRGPLVVYTGRANRAKGVGVLVDAARQLRRIGAKILIVGKVYDPEFQRIAGDNVEFTGFVPPARVPDYLAAADILVLPSTPDLPYAAYTSPLKLFEYMASGRPIVASDLPVLAEILDDEENALLYPARDPAALASAIERVWSDPTFARGLAERARGDVEEFSWDRRAQRILDRIAWVAGER